MPLKNKNLLFSAQLLIIFAAVYGLFHLQSVEQGEDGLHSGIFSSDEIRSKYQITVARSPALKPGVVLVPVVGTEEVLLLNRRGELKHVWSLDAVRARLLPDCNLLVIHGTSSFGKHTQPWSDLRNVVREYSWNGEVVWEYESERVVHHDVHRLPNGNTIFLERAEKRLEDHTSLNKARGHLLRYDVVKEVNSTGKELFEWQAIDHIDTSFCGWQGCNSRLEENRFRENLHDWMHTNTLSLLPENHWYDEGDVRFRPGNLLIMPRNFWTALIVDRDSGEVVWRYKGSDKNPLIRGHEPYMIKKGMPGAGNILIFDNGVAKLRGHSIAREIIPPTRELAWSYSDPERFYSKAAGRVQRLANGNTLISEDRSGRIIEVNKQQEIVWELQVHGHEISRATHYENGHCEPQFS